jgi:uncharacterized membrane protein YccC
MLAACGGGASNEVAVVDLNEVAQATGQDEVIRGRVEGVSIQLTEELRGLLTSMEGQLQAEREKLGTNPAAEDVQRIQALTAQAQQQIGQAQAEANRQVTALEGELAEEFRDKVLPLARKAATSRGATILLARDAYVFWSDDSIDLTSAVIAAWDNLPADQKMLSAGADIPEPAPQAPAEEAATETEAPAE